MPVRQFLELRHQIELHQLTGRVLSCPIDAMNRPRGRGDMALRIPPSEAEVGVLFAGWREELATCRKYAPTARNYAAARLTAEVGIRVNEARSLDLADVHWDLGSFGKLHVRHGKGANGSGPRARMVPLINDAGRTLRWFIEDVWGHFDGDDSRSSAPLLPSERKNGDGTCGRVGTEALRVGLAEAAAQHLPGWSDRLTPLVLRHYCASQLYLSGMDLRAIQELLGQTRLGSDHDAVRPCAAHLDRRGLDRRKRPGSEKTGGTAVVIWNLRLAAAGRGIWKASELQRRLANHGLVISAGR